MIFQNKTAKKLFLTWRTEREIDFLKYSWNESFFSELEKNVGWSEWRSTVSLHELLVWFRHIGKEKNFDWAKHKQHNTVSQYSYSYYHGIYLSAEK